jgi:poly-gamma-glutamate capsule biosynthesis protein CapA/YwtB (metallophosphatase superfamily)
MRFRSAFIINLHNLFFLLVLLSNQVIIAQNLPLTIDSTSLQEREIKITGVGDIMLGTTYPSRSYLPPNEDCSPLLADVKSFLLEADISFGNLEGALIDGGKMSKNCQDTLKCYAFRMPEKFASCLSESGFDILSLANNHSGDFGDFGRKQTMHILDSLEIEHAGLELKPTAEFVKDGVKYGFIAFAPNKGTLDLLNIDEATRMVRDLANRNDIVIVSFHGGAEGKDYQHLPKGSEEFYGEKRGNLYEFAHKMVDAGADIIFGHGPHVTRAMEIYKDRFIAYSLGNFSTYARFNLSGPNGIAPLVQLVTNQTGKFIRGKIIPIYQPSAGGAHIDPQKRVIDVINKLNISDLPDNILKIDANGNF